MTGFPEHLHTRQDYLNAAAYVRQTGEGREKLIARLEHLREDTAGMFLKETSRSKRADRQQQQDYEPMPDAGREKTRLGFTDEEIDCLTGGLKVCSDE